MNKVMMHAYDALGKLGGNGTTIMLGDFAHGPDPIGIGTGDVVHRRAAGIVLDVTHLLVEVVGREIDAGPAGHQHQRAFGADMAAIVLILRLGLGLGTAEDHREHREH